MNTTDHMKRLIVGLTTAALVSGGLGLAAVGPGAGTAQAQPQSQGPNQWCPGQRLPQVGLIWDMSVCHTYWQVPFGRGNLLLDGGAQSEIWDGPDPPPYFEPVCAPFFPQQPCRPPTG